MHFYSTVLSLLRKSIKEGITITRNLSLLHTESRLELVQREHNEIVMAIKESNSQAAREAMKKHLVSARN
ncbi:MAG: FCD domain-containing protein [Marinomonas colpomeniae]